MNPVTHYLVGWLTASTSHLNLRERALITLAGVAPDLDGLGIVAEVLTRNSETPLRWYFQYHHVLGHNLLFGLFLAAVGFALSARRWLTSGLVLLSFHLHIVGDLVGSRGTDGYQWPIYYLYPFTMAWPLTWDGQWELASWQNVSVTAVALFIMFALARKRGYSPLELISTRANNALVETLRRRFPV